MAAPINQPVGDGVTFQYNLTSSQPTDAGWTTMVVIEKVNGNSIKSATVTTTKIADTAVGKQPGIPDYGSFTVEGRFDIAKVSTIAGLQQNKTQFYGRVTVVDNGSAAGSSAISQCFVEEFNPFGALEQNKEIITSITIGINGSTNYYAHA